MNIPTIACVQLGTLYLKQGKDPPISPDSKSSGYARYIATFFMSVGGETSSTSEKLYDMAGVSLEEGGDGNRRGVLTMNTYLAVTLYRASTLQDGKKSDKCKEAGCGVQR